MPNKYKTDTKRGVKPKFIGFRPFEVTFMFIILSFTCIIWCYYQAHICFSCVADADADADADAELHFP